MLHEHAKGPIQRLVQNMPLVKPHHGKMSHHAPTKDSEKGQESDIIRCRNEWGSDLPELQHQGLHIPSLCSAAHLLELPRETPTFKVQGVGTGPDEAIRQQVLHVTNPVDP